MREQDVEVSEATCVPACLEDVRNGQRQKASLDHTVNRQQAIALFRR
jgi:hypothetical protein